MLNKIKVMAITAISVFTMLAPSAEAIVYDRGVSLNLQVQRNTLLVREADLQRDYDDLCRTLDQLTRQNENPRLIDELSRKTSTKFNDLRQVRYDLREVELKLL